MQVSRRNILKVGGAAAIVTAVGAGAMLATPPLSRASEPWSRAGESFGDPRLDALAFAILAPNPHNRQPWQFALVGDDTIDVTCDLDRRLPHTDPFDRQITIGFGCMLELLRMAGEAGGHRIAIEEFPDGEGGERLGSGRIARVRFSPDNPTPDPLFEAVLDRRSNKEPYEPRRPSADDLSPLLSAAGVGVNAGAAVEPGLVDSLRQNAWLAWKTEYEFGPTRRESIELMRIGNDAVVAQPDGIDLGGTTMSLMHAVGLVTKEGLDTPGTTAFETGYDMYRELIDATPAFVWLTTRDNRRRDQLASGASWVRANLAAQANGIALHPWSQALQEFPEMAEHYAQIHRMLVPDGGTVQMFARAGYAANPPASPRWPLEAKLVTA